MIITLNDNFEFKYIYENMRKERRGTLSPSSKAKQYQNKTYLKYLQGKIKQIINTWIHL